MNKKDLMMLGVGALVGMAVAYMREDETHSNIGGTRRKRKPPCVCANTGNMYSQYNAGSWGCRRRCRRDFNEAVNN